MHKHKLKLFGQENVGYIRLVFRCEDCGTRFSVSRQWLRSKVLGYAKGPVWM